MTVPNSSSYPAGNLNAAVPPQTLLVGTAYIWNGVQSASIILPQSPVRRSITRVVLACAALGPTDMVSSTYWDGVSTQAPFYVFLGTPAVSNYLDVTLIGNLNVNELLSPIRIPAFTDIWGVWAGVSTASVTKCIASFYCEAY